MANHDDLISQFCEITGTSTDQATEYLGAYNWDLDSAATAFLADQDEIAEPTLSSSDTAPADADADADYTGPRTLDGRPAPQYASSASAGKKPAKRTGLATLGSLGHDHDEDDEDDDEEEDERKGPRDLFAGGEKSGIAVQDPAQRSSDPRKLINDIVAKAKANAQHPGDSSSSTPEPSNRFRGSGQTLGGDGVESRTIPDPHGNPIPTAGGRDGPVQERVLHLWADGFSIDEGDLIRFDDPAHIADLQMIRQGRAPLHLMNVRYDQPVDVKLQQHTEKYKPLPKKYKPFSGEGHRLGSPVPGDGGPSPAFPSVTSQPAAPVSPSQPPSTGVDESQPTLVLRVQLPDGTRLPARFNSTQTVGDVYQFIALSLPAGSSGRPWVLATTFPNKEHTDKSLVLGEVPEFKKGGTAVVKWA
ncbi:SEP-domain-containing protein [Thozetella sp. PMI_491]|nr:SEP-domain-containing protein [Thozetella sp. PMI_491]